MIGMEQQLRRIAEGRVAREPAGVGMPVRADDRQARHLFIEPARDVALRRIGRKEAVGGEQQRTRHRLIRSEEHTSELQSLMRISYAVLCLKKKKKQIQQ